MINTIVLNSANVRKQYEAPVRSIKTLNITLSMIKLKYYFVNRYTLVCMLNNSLNLDIYTISLYQYKVLVHYFICIII